MRRLIIIINLSLIVAFMMMFADCSDSSKDRKQVSIGYVNWSEGIAMSYLAKVMLESKGYDVMLRNADIAPDRRFYVLRFPGSVLPTLTQFLYL